MRRLACVFVSTLSLLGAGAASAQSSGGVSASVQALDLWIEEHAPAKQGVATPAHWKESERDALQKSLEPLQPFFDGVRETLATPDCRQALEGRRAIFAEGATLLCLRNQANILCAKAIATARSTGDEREAARWLVLAFEWARLRDSGLVISALVRAGTQGIAIDALVAIEQVPEIDVSRLQLELEPVLRLESSSFDLERVARAELQGALQIDGRGAPSFDDLTAIESMLAFAREPSRSSNALEREQWDKSHSAFAFAQAWPATVDSVRFSQTRIDLERVFLALRARARSVGRLPARLDDLRVEFENNVPRDSRTNRPFTYELSGTYVRVAAEKGATRLERSWLR